MADKLDSTKGLTSKTFHTLYRDVARETELMQSKAADYRNACKRLDKAGCDMKALRLALQIQKMEDDSQVAFMREFLRLAKWLQLGLVKQQDLFLRVADIEEPAVEDLEKTEEVVADMDGYNHGKAGGETSGCPHVVGTLKHAAWTRGCLRGIENTTVDTSAPREKPASKARRRPTAQSIANPGLN